MNEEIHTRLTNKLKIKTDRRMFNSNIVSRLNQLYLIQTLIELQRSCEKLYTSFKHKLLILVSKKVWRNKLKRLQQNQRSYYTNGDDYYGCGGGEFRDDKEGFEAKGREGLNNNNNIRGALKHLFSDQGQDSGLISIPMQMLLLPFIVQPHGLLGNVRKPASKNNNNISNLSARAHIEQYHGVNGAARGADEMSGFAQSHYVMLVPGQLVPAQTPQHQYPYQHPPLAAQSASARQHSVGAFAFGHEKASQIQFAPATDTRRQKDYPGYNSSRSSYWSPADGSQRSLRNPLLNCSRR